METTQDISYIVSFIAGILIFFSPCVLPLIPSYLSYLTGISFEELQGDLNFKRRKEIQIITVIHSVLFILGFSIVFVLLGMAVTILVKFFLEYQLVLKKIGEK